MYKYRDSTFKELAHARAISQNPYAYQDSNGNLVATTRTNEHKANLCNQSKYKQIEQEARKLQRTIWEKRHELWPEGVPTDPVELLNPEIAIKYIGYYLETPEYLGEYYIHNAHTDTGGIINRSEKKIIISNRFSSDSQRFTAAHELGHALLHHEMTMHRDLPIDGSNTPHEPIEREANKFATFYLMPEKLVRNRFMQLFGTEYFTLTEETAFALDPKDPINLIQRCNNTYELAKTLAKTDYFNGNHVKSLATQFKVSTKTMAIRINELNLIQN